MPSSTSTSDAAAPAAAGWRYPLGLLLAWLCLLLAPAVMNVLVDPCQIFHRSWLERVFFYKDNERYQVAGLLRHYLAEGPPDYDGVVVGSSISANISSGAVRDTLGWNGLNLSMRASGLSERSFVLQQALATGRVRHVLLEFYAVDVDDSVASIGADSAFPTYLYSDSLRDKSRYLFNLSIARASLMLLQQNGLLPSLPAPLQEQLTLDPAIWGESGPDNWSVWIHDAGHLDHFGDFSTPANRQRMQAELDARRQQYGRAILPVAGDFTAARRYMVDLVHANPTVSFDIWFAPVSLARYVLDADPALAGRNVAVRRFLVQALADAPNARIFGFDNALDITADPRNYMDYSHYSPAVQQRLLQDMAAGRHQLTVDNIDDYVAQFRHNLATFEIPVAAEPRPAAASSPASAPGNAAP